MWLVNRQGQLWALFFTCIVRHHAGASPALELRGCDGNPYCQTVDGKVTWGNDCGIEGPSEDHFEKHKHEDVLWLRGHMGRYLRLQRNHQLERDEATFPAYFAKRFAPDHAPSSMQCDGLNSCVAPSCKDVGALLSDNEKRRALLFFDFMSVCNHGHHAMAEATQDFFIELSMDAEWITKRFNYADDLQDLAKEKKRKREMWSAIANNILLSASAITGAAALWGPAILNGMRTLKTLPALARLAKAGSKSSKVVQNVAKGLKLPGEAGAYGQGMGKQLTNLNSALSGIITSGFIGTTGLMKEVSKIKHGDDEEGFDKFLPEFKHYLAGMSQRSSDQTAQQMLDLSMGRKTAGGKNLIDLYESGFYSDPNINLRGHIKATMERYYYSQVISRLWQIDGAGIKASRTIDGQTCEQDTRGNPEGKVCLYERPYRVYYVQAIARYGDNKIRHPDGMDELLVEGGFKSLSLEDFVRSALFQDEVWRPKFKNPGEPDIQTLLEESTQQVPSAVKRSSEWDDIEFEDLDTIPVYTERGINDNSALPMDPDRVTLLLDHYGQVPGAVLLPICYTWYGEAISDIDSGHNSNAPCLCDPPAPYLAKRWDDSDNYTMAYTKRYIKDSKLYEMDEYGSMCRKHNGCKEDGEWAPLLGIDGKDVAKQMKTAWRICKHPRGHGHHKPLPNSSMADQPAPQVETANQPAPHVQTAVQPVVVTQTQPVLNTTWPATAIATAAPSTTSPPVFTKFHYDVGGSETIVTVFGDYVTYVFPDSTWLGTVSRPYETVSVAFDMVGTSVRVVVTTITAAAPVPTV